MIRRGLFLAGLALASCTERPDPRICVSPHTLEASLKERDQAPPGDIPAVAAAREFAVDCVHRWAYRLARGDEAPGAVAAASIASCSDAVGEWDAAAKRAHTRLFGDAPEEYVSRRNGERVPIVQANREELTDQAVAWTVQARAGHCAVP